MDTKKVLKTTLTTLLAIALIFGSGIGIAKAASNAYCTLTGGMESANKAAASMKNNTGTKRYGTVTIQTKTGTVLSSNSDSINPEKSMYTSYTGATKYDTIYASCLIRKDWTPQSGVASTLKIRIK